MWGLKTKLKGGSEVSLQSQQGKNDERPLLLVLLLLLLLLLMVINLYLYACYQVKIDTETCIIIITLPISL